MGQTQPFIQISIRFAPAESFYLSDEKPCAIWKIFLTKKLWESRLMKSPNRSFWKIETFFGRISKEIRLNKVLTQMFFGDI